SLDETSKNVYKENVSLTESVRIFKTELDELQKMKEILLRQNANMNSEKELNELLVKEKVEQSQKQNKSIKELKDKVQFLENSLTQFINEFEIERKKLIEQNRIETESSKNEVIKLQRA
ncbi:unnamed protein product, partial [Didymodactylos carnosus]